MTNADIAREILSAQSYVVLATADADGEPWASPVWFALEEPSELFWVSDPEVRHSRNIAARPGIALVVFDSTVPPGTGQAVYMRASAEQLTDPAAIEHGLGVYSCASVRAGIGEWKVDRVTGEARLRLYRARIHEHSILDPDLQSDAPVLVTP